MKYRFYKYQTREGYNILLRAMESERFEWWNGLWIKDQAKLGELANPTGLKEIPMEEAFLELL